MMDGARVIQVIETTLTRRGTGKDESSPIRVITQYWSLEGNLLAEVDPVPADEVPNGMAVPLSVWREMNKGASA